MLVVATDDGLDGVTQFVGGAIDALGDGVDDRLRQAMKDEVVELVTYITNSNQGLKELFTTNVSFARYPTLMRLYNVSTPAPANITDSNAVRLPAGERSGLLTRSAIIFSGGQTENPMHRGVTIRKNLLCKTIPPPPANLKEALVPPAVDPNCGIGESPKRIAGPRHHRRDVAIG